MSDALTYLRNFVKNKKDFHEEDDKIIFGDVYFNKNVKTTYLIYGTGKDDRPKDYYTLECLAFLIKNRELQHSMYVKNAGTRNISVVLRPDRRDLLSYLDGEVETSSSIDKYAPIEIAMQRPQPYVKSSSSSNYNKRSAMTMEEDQDQDYHSKVSKTGDMSSQMETDQMASQATKEQFISRLTQKFDETAAQSSRPITENIMPLSEKLSVEKIVAIKLKKKAQDRTKLSTGVEMDDDLIPGRSGSQNMSTSQSSQSKKEDRSHSSSQSKYNFDYTSGTSSFLSGITMVGADDSDAIMREIIQRERVCRTRFSVLQSTGKQFDKDITAFLQSIKAREEGADSSINTSMNMTNPLNGSQSNSMMMSQNMASQKSRPLGYNRFDQERYSAKDETGGFSIDTKLTYQPNGGSITLSTATNSNLTSSASSSSTSTQPTQNIFDNLSSQTKSTSLTSSSQSNSNSKPQFQSTQLSQQKTNVLSSGNGSSAHNNSKSKYQSSSGSSSSKRIHATPIIIIPAARTSLIQMINASDILQELKYVSTDEKRKLLQNQNVYKEAELILHRKEDGSTVQFKVIDQPAKLAPHDWDRVVAVFAQGAQWQFKDWPLGDGNPTDIFCKVKGFHLKLSGIPLDPNIAKWSVSVIELDPHKRHLDRARLLSFWDELDKYMSKFKPQFCS